MNGHEGGHRSADHAAAEQSRRPGHELGAARERAGIPLEEMASRLHLSRDHVEAIERDDYDHLPAAAFVRGYLRAYSKEVGINADNIVAEFDEICDEPNAPELVVGAGEPDPAASRGPMVAILILVAVAIVGAAAWWLQQESVVELPGVTMDGVTGENETMTGETSVEEGTSTTEAGTYTDATATGMGLVETESDAVAAPDADAGDVDAGTGDPEAGIEAEAVAPDDDENRSTGDPVAEVDEPAVGEGEPETLDEAAGSELEAGMEPDAESTVGGAAPDGPLSTDSADLAATTAAASGPNRLVIEVDGESWLEVYDARGRRLVYTLYSGESPVVLNGWAPFDVFLGNSPTVTVRVDDETLDQSAFVRSDNTARFLADDEGARRR